MTGETRRLYYLRGELASWDATVLEVERLGDGERIVLDETIFYPEGGGQPCDLGTLGGLPLDRVSEDGERVCHFLKGPSGLAAGARVRLELDAGRRRYHTQQHSGQHLLSAILERDYGIHTIGFHLGQEYSTIDVDCPEFPLARQREAEAKAEAFIVENHPFLIHHCDEKSAASFPLRKKLPPGESSIRIAEIQGYDWVACCGTHVSSAKDIRALALLSTERYKGNTRVYFLAGDKAIAWMRGEALALGEIAAGLGTSPREAKARIEALAAKAESLEAENARLRRQRAEADIRAAALSEGGEATMLTFSFSDRDAEEAAETAKAGPRLGFDTLCISEPDKTVLASFRADSARPGEEKLLIDTLKALLGGLGGRGGGGKGNFRASFPELEKARAFYEGAFRVLSDFSQRQGPSVVR